MCGVCAQRAFIAYGFGALISTGCAALSYYFRIPILTPLLGVAAARFWYITLQIQFVALPREWKRADDLVAKRAAREEQREEQIKRSYLL